MKDFGFKRWSAKPSIENDVATKNDAAKLFGSKRKLFGKSSLNDESSDSTSYVSEAYPKPINVQKDPEPKKFVDVNVSKPAGFASTIGRKLRFIKDSSSSSKYSDITDLEDEEESEISDVEKDTKELSERFRDHDVFAKDFGFKRWSAKPSIENDVAPKNGASSGSSRKLFGKSSLNEEISDSTSYVSEAYPKPLNVQKDPEPKEFVDVNVSKPAGFVSAMERKPRFTKGSGSPSKYSDITDLEDEEESEISVVEKDTKELSERFRDHDVFAKDFGFKRWSAKPSIENDVAPKNDTSKLFRSSRKLFGKSLKEEISDSTSYVSEAFITPASTPEKGSGSSSNYSNISDTVAKDEEKSESEICNVEKGNKELSEQFCDHGVLKCAIDGYQTTTDNGSLLSLSRTGAPRSRSGAFRPFKFTEKKVMEVDSVDVAEDAFCWMIAPVGLNYFYKFIYERIVLRVSRRDSNYFKEILTCDNLLQISQNFNLKYGRNLNVLKYSDPLAKVEYFNPETDKVFSSQLKTLIENGRSIELKNPQIYSDEVWYLCEILQELTNTVVGSKVYLTGKESSAFPSHCDDFNNIVLQLEGKQVWRIWAPKYLNSTEKFKEIVTPTSDDLKKMKLVFDDTLNEGDTIYIPKGFYYDSYTGNQHSLHLNIEWSKNMTFTEMMKSISTNVWDQIEKDEPLSKRSLPLNVLLMGGEACIDYDQPSPDNDYESVVTKLSSKVEKYYNDTIPLALDNLAKSYLRTALPPMLTGSERRQSIHGHSSLMIGDADLKFTNETKVKLIRMHTQRLLYDKERNPYLAHRINNSRNTEENVELKTIGIEKDMIKGVITLFDQYPKWTKITKLYCTEEISMELVKLLYNNGLLMAI